MQRKGLPVVIFSFCLLAALPVSAAEPTAGVLSVEEVKRVVPPSYFLHSRSASVRLRNSAGFRTPDGKLVLAGLVDTTGYASAVAEKYQGFLITELKLSVERSNLPPGEYGFGFSKDGKFLVMDVGGNDLFSVSSHLDEKLRRPVPLTIVADQDSYLLRAGKTSVSLKAQ